MYHLRIKKQFAFCTNPETRYNSEITYEYRAYVDGLKIKLGQASLSIKKPGNIDGVNGALF